MAATAWWRWCSRWRRSIRRAACWRAPALPSSPMAAGSSSRMRMRPRSRSASRPDGGRSAARHQPIRTNGEPPFTAIPANGANPIMRAVVLHEHGDNDKLQFIADYPTPKAGEGDVVIRVRASSITYPGVSARRGMPGIKVPLPVIIGLDVVGEISELGAGVTGWNIGDRVLIDPVNRVEGGLMGETQDGGLAEFCRAKAHQLVKIPEAVSFEQAAALPVAYGTAIRMMNSIGKIQ